MFSHINRVHAFLIHLAISAIVFSILLGVMFFIWYAGPFLEADGGFGILSVVGGVDVVLGPLLTLIVFKANKPSLKFDLSVIAFIQIAVLLYGGHLIFKERPVYAVFSSEQFVIVSASQLALRGDDYSVGIFSKPSYRISLYPNDPEIKQQYEDQFLHGHDFEVASVAPELYRPYEEKYQWAIDAGSSLTKFMSYSDEYTQNIEQFLSKHEVQNDQVVGLPLLGKRKIMTLVLRKSDGAILGAIDIDSTVMESSDSSQDSPEAVSS